MLPNAARTTSYECRILLTLGHTGRRFPHSEICWMKTSYAGPGFLAFFPLWLRAANATLASRIAIHPSSKIGAFQALNGIRRGNANPAPAHQITSAQARLPSSTNRAKTCRKMARTDLMPVHSHPQLVAGQCVMRAAMQREAARIWRRVQNRVPAIESRDPLQSKRSQSLKSICRPRI